MTWTLYENETFQATPVVEAFLRRVLRGNLETSHHGLRIIRVAGHLRLPDGRTLLVRSRKASGANLLAWLAYGDESLSALRTLGSLPEASAEADFGSLVARLFCMETWRAVQTTGLLRAYHRQHVHSAVVRGRIDFSRVARTGGDLSKTPCIVFSRLPDTPLNRLLAAAIIAVQRDPSLRAASGTALPQLAALFAEVRPVIDADRLNDTTPLSRLETPFALAASLARLILRSAGTVHGSAQPGMAFLINLADLFERTVARAFRDSGVTAIPKHPLQILRGPGVGPALASHMPMEIDVFLPDLPEGPVVVDAKYKTAISAANLQQMATYCWLTGARLAVLVVPEGIIKDRRPYLLNAPVPGAAKIQVEVVELCLSGDSLAAWGAAARDLVNAIAPASARS